jgi:hypothetical protein
MGGRLCASEGCGNSRHTEPTMCRHMTSALFFCHGKAYRLFRNPGLLPDVGETLLFPLMGEG